MTDEFELFWNEYPRKCGKGQARRAWISAIRKVDADTIIRAARAYAERGIDMRFIKYPSTWLNGECWQDDLNHVAPSPIGEREWSVIQKLLHQYHWRYQHERVVIGLKHELGEDMTDRIRAFGIQRIVDGGESVRQQFLSFMTQGICRAG